MHMEQYEKPTQSQICVPSRLFSLACMFIALKLLSGSANNYYVGSLLQCANPKQHIVTLSISISLGVVVGALNTRIQALSSQVKNTQWRM